eukprot:3637482-Amphidinium_carterae.1
MGMTSCKPVGTPASECREVWNEERLSPEDAKKFRSICMRMSFISQDMPHLLYSVKEAARHMSAPTA